MNRIEELIKQNNTYFDFDNDTYFKLFEKKNLNEFGKFRIVVKPVSSNQFSFKAFRIDGDLSTNGVSFFYDDIHVKEKLFKDVVDEIIRATEPFGGILSMINNEDSSILNQSSTMIKDQPTNPIKDDQSFSIRIDNSVKEKDETLDPSKDLSLSLSKDASIQEKPKAEGNLSGFDNV